MLEEFLVFSPESNVVSGRNRYNQYLYRRNFHFDKINECKYFQVLSISSFTFALTAIGHLIESYGSGHFLNTALHFRFKEKTLPYV